MSLIYVLIVVLIVLAVMGLPHWGYMRPYGYGYYPLGGVGLILVVLIILLLLGRL